ncbi:MAG: hypothetical protein L3K19_08100 [Thermoplasmata archaeon]|nr:hypothetical protein [Thermoplasmata archaeon]
MGELSAGDRSSSAYQAGVFSPERAVRLIFEFSNRGMYGQALALYMPDAKLTVAGGERPGSYAVEGLESLIEVAIKEYGQPRVTIEELHVFGSKVYAETTSRTVHDDGRISETREVHILKFSGEKVGEHRVFTNAVAPLRLQGE